MVIAEPLERFEPVNPVVMAELVVTAEPVVMAGSVVMVEVVVMAGSIELLKPVVMAAAVEMVELRSTNIFAILVV